MFLGRCLQKEVYANIPGDKKSHTHTQNKIKKANNIVLPSVQPPFNNRRKTLKHLIRL